MRESKQTFHLCEYFGAYHHISHTEEIVLPPMNFDYHLMEKTDNAPRKNTFPSPHSWPSAGVRCFFFFFLPYTPSLRVCMERRRKKHSHSCTVPGVGRGKCIFSGRIVRFLHMGVLQLIIIIMVISCTRIQDQRARIV